MTLTDTGPLVALIVSTDPDHARCREALLRGIAPPLITTWPCFTEAMYMVYREGGFPGQEALWALRRAGRLVLHDTSTSEADRMEAAMMQYRDAPMDLADASLVAAADALGVQRVFTVDRHFYAYRRADGTAFEVVP